MEESPAEQEERLNRREERLQRQHDRIKESRVMPSNSSGGSSSVGKFFGGVGTFFGEHKIVVIIAAVGIVAVSMIAALKKKGTATSGSTANQTPNYATAGYQTSGEATAFQQLGQQLDNIQSQLTSKPTANNPPAATITPNTFLAKIGLGTPNYNQINQGFPIRSTPGATYGKNSNVISRAPFGSTLEISGPAVTGTSNYGPNKSGGSNLWYPVLGGGYVSAMDVTKITPAYQAPSVANSSTVSNNTTSNIFNPGSFPNQAIVLQSTGS